ncbi:MAG: NAD(P)H-dependent oxidoreductase subunit E [Endomicrobiales bacterium]|nr:NAD(P)H-dependent oxidoreductase subunit E [Endomicrobiales bacterium]
MESNLISTIEPIIKRWRGKDGNLIMILHEIQDHYGYVPRSVSLYISSLLNIPLARIYEVITFYNYFKLEAPGKHKISVCMGTACYLRGASQIFDEVKTVLQIEEGETTKDGMFTLDIVRCLGCCGLAPVMMIDGHVYGKVKKNEITEILSKYNEEQ